METTKVLILILMECLLRAFPGAYITLLAIVLILILMECLLSLKRHEKASVTESLNPYSNGMLT